MNAREFDRAVRRGLRTGDWGRFEDWLFKNGSYYYDYDLPAANEWFSEAVFQRILRLLEDPSFLAAAGSHQVLRLLSIDWALFSVEQKRQLLPAIITAYPRFQDPLSLHLLAEFLGRYYADAQALTALDELRQVASDDGRSLVPMGLRYLVRYASSAEVKDEAYRKLLEMKSDADERVRDEAELALWGLDPNQGGATE